MLTAKPLLVGRLLGTAIVLTLTSSACSPEAPQASQPQALPVKLQDIGTATLEDSSEFVGSLEARERVVLAPRVDGRILNIAVSEGENVSQGQTIIQLQLEREQEDVNAATQNVNVERARLGQVQAELRTAEANRATAAAQVESARADLQDLEAEVELAQINIERTKTLVEGGALPQQDLDDANRDLKSSIAQRNSRQETLNAAIKSLQAAERQVEQARANIESQNAAIKRTEAELGSISQNLAFNTINAPIDGIVGDIIPRVGDYVDAGDQLTTITQNQTLDLNIQVPIEQASQLELGLPVAILDNNGQAIVEGQISFVSPRVNSNQQVLLAKATFDNNGSLKDDQFVRARVIWSEQPGVLVPTEAVSRIGGQEFVFVAQEQTGENGETNLVAKQRPVQLGDIQGQAYQVISGVNPGEQIVVSGILNLSDGVPIDPESLTSSNQAE